MREVADNGKDEGEGAQAAPMQAHGRAGRSERNGRPPPRRYLPEAQKLLTQASKRAVAVKLAGDRMAQIGEVLKYDAGSMIGQIWTYTQIDQNKPVLDLRTTLTRTDERRSNAA
jgi:hypothetical protein